MDLQTKIRRLTYCLGIMSGAQVIFGIAALVFGFTHNYEAGYYALMYDAVIELIYRRIARYIIKIVPMA